MTKDATTRLRQWACKRARAGRLCLALLALPLASLAVAQNLYGPGTPDNASYIRVVHAAPEAPEATARVGGALSGDSVAYGEVSDYALVLTGETQVAAEVGEETLELSLDVAPLAFYTVALVGRGGALELLLIEDQVSDNLARTLLALYNFSDALLELRTADGETVVVEGVAYGQAAGVMVNPVTVDLAVFEGNDLRHALGEVQLEAGEAYSVIVVGEDQALLVRAASGD